jgi:4-phosphopantoate--beta-alanine ligase
MTEIPQDHPRAESLRVRHAIIEGMHRKIVAEAGLIAHGRGEAFDYLLGEKSHKFSKNAINAAAAMLFLAKSPVISVNGNTSILCLSEMIAFSRNSKIPLEVNLFYRSKERIVAIRDLFAINGYPDALGLDENQFTTIPELSSRRRIVDARGIKIADVVVVPLEDGDRTEALVNEGKNVITIDLNPLSRTAQKADITIIDNVIRVFPLLNDTYNKIETEEQAQQILENYDNKSIIKKAMKTISSYWESQ